MPRFKPQPVIRPLAVDITTTDIEPGSVSTARAGSVALIRARGFLANDPDVWDFLDSYGGDVANLEELNAAIRAADLDPDVSRIVLDLSGIGSDADRMAETMATIRGASKPTAAWVGTYAYSGFGFMALSADVVAGSSSATIGSLAVILGFQGADPESRLEFISTSALKREMAGGKLTPKVRDELMRRVAGLEQVLRRSVMDSRGEKVSDPQSVFSGRSFTGQAAIDAGLIDSLHPTREAFLASLNEEDPLIMADPRPAAPSAADPQAAPQGATASTPEVDEKTFLRGFRTWLFSGSAEASSPPAPPANSPNEAAELAQLRERLARQEAAIEDLKAQAAAADIKARVASCAALPADAVEHVTKLAAACCDPKVRDEALAALAAIKPARLSPSLFGDIPAVGTAGGSSRLVGPPGADPREVAAVEAARAECKDDQAALERRLEEIYRQEAS